MSICQRCGCDTRLRGQDVVAVPQIGAAHYWERCLWWIVKPIQRSITNLLINPSFERGMDGWVGMNANTILSLSQDESFRGLQSLCVQTDVEEPYGVGYDILVLAGRTYCATFWVKGCPGDTLTTTFAPQVTAAIFIPEIQEGSATIELNGDWQEVQLCLVNGTTSALVSTLSIFTTRDGACARFYVDAVAMVDNDEPVSYFDGDQHGATWDGTPHASPSTAAAGQRQIGTPVNLQECGFNPIGDGGWGMPPVEPVVLSFARRPGALYQRSHVLPRPISIRGTVEGCPCDVHRVRQKLVELVGLWDVEDCDEEFLLRYQWTNDCGDPIGEPLEMPVTYVSGLEGSRIDLQRQIIELGFVAYEYPLWRSAGDRCQVLQAGENVVRYGGSTAAAVTMEIRSGFHRSIRNETSGSVLAFNYDPAVTPGLVVQSGDEYLRFNSQPGEVDVLFFPLTGGSPTGDSALGVLDYRQSRPARWRLVPGENVVHVDADLADGEGLILCWRETHLSADAVDCCAC